MSFSFFQCELSLFWYMMEHRWILIVSVRCNCIGSEDIWTETILVGCEVFWHSQLALNINWFSDVYVLCMQWEFLFHIVHWKCVSASTSRSCTLFSILCRYSMWMWFYFSLRSLTRGIARLWLRLSQKRLNLFNFVLSLMTQSSTRGRLLIFASHYNSINVNRVLPYLRLLRDWFINLLIT